MHPENQKPVHEYKNIPIIIGDRIDIEFTNVDIREHINVFVSHNTINNGKGIAVFFNDEGNVFLWKPSKESPHGTVERVDERGGDFLVNPYVKVYSTEHNKFTPVHSYSGCYLVRI